MPQQQTQLEFVDCTENDMRRKESERCPPKRSEEQENEQEVRQHIPENYRERLRAAKATLLLC